MYTCVQSYSATWTPCRFHRPQPPPPHPCTQGHSVKDRKAQCPVLWPHPARLGPAPSRAPLCPWGSEAAEGLGQEEGRSGLAGAELEGLEQGGLDGRGPQVDQLSSDLARQTVTTLLRHLGKLVLPLSPSVEQMRPLSMLRELPALLEVS